MVAVAIKSNRRYNDTVKSTIVNANIVSKNIDSGMTTVATKLTVDMFTNIYNMFKDNELKGLLRTDLGDFDFLIPNFNRDRNPRVLDVNYIRLKQSTRDTAEIILYYADRVSTSNNVLIRILLTQSNKGGVKATKEVSKYKRILGEKVVMQKIKNNI